MQIDELPAGEQTQNPDLDMNQVVGTHDILMLCFDTLRYDVSKEEEEVQDGSKCACVILEELHITQPTLSHHMKILCDTGLVDSCKCGKWMYYSLSLEGGRTLRALVERYTISEEAYADYKTCESCRDSGAGDPCQDDGKEAGK